MNLLSELNADVQTSNSGVVSSNRIYDAFGNDLSVSGSWKSPFGYAGQSGYRQDVDTGLKLLGHRYYDSDTGRFLTRDPIKDGRNWYGYCGNDPVRYFDSSGLLAIAFGIEVSTFSAILGKSLQIGFDLDVGTGDLAFAVSDTSKVGAGFGIGLSGFGGISNGGAPKQGKVKVNETVGIGGSLKGDVGISGAAGGTREIRSFEEFLSPQSSRWDLNLEGQVSTGPQAEVEISLQYGHSIQVGLFNVYALVQDSWASARDCIDQASNSLNDDRLHREIKNFLQVAPL